MFLAGAVQEAPCDARSGEGVGDGGGKQQAQEGKCDESEDKGEEEDMARGERHGRKGIQGNL